MVATAVRKSRNGFRIPEGDTRPINQRSTDGRRQLFGLSQAIREKAFQSTSPSSEAKLCNRVANGNGAKQECHGNARTKLPPSIEDRLKSLLDSDIEGATETYQIKKPSMNVLQRKQNERKTPTSHVVGHNYDVTRGFKVMSSSGQREKIIFNNGTDEYIATGSVAQQQQVYNSAHQRDVTSQRRCKSTIPVAIDDKDWNKVASYNYQSTPCLVKKTPSPEVKRALEGRKTPTPFTSTKSVSRPTSTGPYFGIVGRQRNPDEQRPVPAMRRSLYFENKPSGSHMVLEQGSDLNNPSMRLVRSPVKQRSSAYPNHQTNGNLHVNLQTHSNSHVNQQTLNNSHVNQQTHSNSHVNQQSHSNSHVNQQTHSNSHVNQQTHDGNSHVDQQTDRNPNINHQPLDNARTNQSPHNNLHAIHGNSNTDKYIHVSTSNPAPAHKNIQAVFPCQVGPKNEFLVRSSLPTAHLQRCKTPSPSTRKNLAPDTSQKKNDQPQFQVDHKLGRHITPGQHKTRNKEPDYYPQQNFSFRRAVHRSISSESELNAPSDIKYQVNNTTKSPQSDRRQLRKSDDRDSGAVVEPDVSMFDFDSSVLTDDNDDLKVHDVTDTSPTKRNELSRSSTPILPPLSSDEDNFSPYQNPRKSEQDQGNRPSQSSPLLANKEICLRNGKPENKVKPRLRVSDSLLNDATERSSTPKHLTESQTRKYEQRTVSTKVVSSKLQKHASGGRRGYHSRASSGDEKKCRKSHQRRNYEDSDLTDCSQQEMRCKNPGKREPPPYTPYRTSKVMYHQAEFGDTSSVRSMTTTSVCSSVLRKTGSRRHSRRHHLGVIDKYSKEIRSVTKRFIRLESHVVTLARSLAQLSSELRQQNVTSRDIEDLRHQIEEIQVQQLGSTESPRRNKGVRSMVTKGGNQPKMTKLAKFFGEQPPLLHLFLKQLGYEKYIKNFECESIGMMELPYMDEKRLHDIGIPLGPRLRIMKEAQKSSYV